MDFGCVVLESYFDALGLPAQTSPHSFRVIYSSKLADYSLKDKVMCLTLSWSVCCPSSVNTREQRVSHFLFVRMLIGVHIHVKAMTVLNRPNKYLFEVSSYSAHNFKTMLCILVHTV